MTLPESFLGSGNSTRVLDPEWGTVRDGTLHDPTTLTQPPWVPSFLSRDPPLSSLLYDLDPEIVTCSPPLSPRSTSFPTWLRTSTLWWSSLSLTLTVNVVPHPILVPQVPVLTLPGTIYSCSSNREWGTRASPGVPDSPRPARMTPPAPMGSGRTVTRNPSSDPDHTSRCRGGP